MEHHTFRDAVSNFIHSIMTFLGLMARNRVGFVGFLVVIGFILLALIGPYFVPLDTSTHVSQIYQPPSWKHPLGTDHQGRDIWAQIVHGGKDILYVAFLAGFLSTLIAVTFGSLTAIVGGVVDSIIMTITDIVLTIPQFPLLAVLAGFVRLNSLTLLALLLAVLNWPTLLRAVRSQVLSLKERDYVEAAVALDMGLRHIIFSEILPNMMSYIIISMTLAMTGAIYAQVGLIFLGLVPMSGQNWAVMIQLAWVRGAIFFKDSIYYIMSPVLAIAFFQLALVSMTRSLEEVFNPRLRAGF
ncbi:MAG: ABC transporter permease [Anaerolineae bacterium]|nr:ABC transporter permease [Anaerolineae bacterium]